MFNYRNIFSILIVALCMRATHAQAYVPKLIIENMTGGALTISNTGGYLDLESHGNGWVHDEALILGDVVCSAAATVIFESLPGKLQCGDTYFLSPDIHQKWIAGKIRLWGGIRIFWSEPDVKPIVSAELLKKAVESQQDIVVHIKNEKWIESIFKLRKSSRHYRISQAYCFGVDTQSFTQRFQQAMYNSQQRFIKKDTFNTLTTPYLEEMERSLCVFKYYEQHDFDEERLSARAYLINVFEYFVACFCDVVHDKASTLNGIGEEASVLQGELQRLEKRGILQGRTWQEEYQKTADIVHRMAVAYYEALPPRKKLKVWWLKSINRLEYGVFFRQKQYY